MEKEDPNRLRKYHQKEHRKRLKVSALETYGSQCICCGEDDAVFLTINHMAGEDQSTTSRAHLYQWLKNNDYPPEFQTLCYNCSCARRSDGRCPGKHLKRQQTLAHDHNFLMKLASEFGDFARYYRELSARVAKIEEHIKK